MIGLTEILWSRSSKIWFIIGIFLCLVQSSICSGRSSSPPSEDGTLRDDSEPRTINDVLMVVDEPMSDKDEEKSTFSKNENIATINPVQNQVNLAIQSLHEQERLLSRNKGSLLDSKIIAQQNASIGKLKSFVDNEQNEDAMWVLANTFATSPGLRNMTKSLEYFELMAMKGNSTAQWRTGVYYSLGLGTSSDRAKALSYYTLAAQGDCTEAHMTLGYMYYKGLYVYKDDEKATRHYKIVADHVIKAYTQQFPPLGPSRTYPMYNLADEVGGGLYGPGASTLPAPNTLPHIPTESLEGADLISHLKVQSENDEPLSLVRLGHLFYYGLHGVPKRFRTALAFYHLAAKDLMKLPLDGVDGDDAADDAAKKQGLKNAPQKPEIFRIIHHAQVPESMRNRAEAAGRVGWMYMRGEGLNRANNVTAVTWFKRGAEWHDPGSLTGLGVMYLNGQGGVQKDYIMAKQLFVTAGERAHPEALTQLGLMSLKSLQPRYDHAWKHFSLAAYRGHTVASYQLAEMAYYGLGRSKDFEIAATRYKAVAETQLTEMSMCTDAHTAFQNNELIKASYLYLMAAESGLEAAQSSIAWLLDSEKYSFPENMIPHTQALRSNQMESTFNNVTHSKKISYTYYHRAANQHNTDARVRCGDLHYYGLSEDAEESGFSKFKSIAKVSNYESQGIGNSVPQNPSRTSQSEANDVNAALLPLEPSASMAALFYSQAAAQHSAIGAYSLGYLHEYGLGVAQDYWLAKRYYDATSEYSGHGHGTASWAVGICRVRLIMKVMWKRILEEGIILFIWRTWQMRDFWGSQQENAAPASSDTFDNNPNPDDSSPTNEDDVDHSRVIEEIIPHPDDTDHNIDYEGSWGNDAMDDFDIDWLTSELNLSSVHAIALVLLVTMWAFLTYYRQTFRLRQAPNPPNNPQFVSQRTAPPVEVSLPEASSPLPNHQNEETNVSRGETNVLSSIPASTDNVESASE